MQCEVWTLVLHWRRTRQQRRGGMAATGGAEQYFDITISTVNTADVVSTHCWSLHFLKFESSRSGVVTGCQRGHVRIGVLHIRASLRDSLVTDHPVACRDTIVAPAIHCLHGAGPGAPKTEAFAGCGMEQLFSNVVVQHASRGAFQARYSYAINRAF